MFELSEEPEKNEVKTIFDLDSIPKGAMIKFLPDQDSGFTWIDINSIIAQSITRTGRLIVREMEEKINKIIADNNV